MQAFGDRAAVFTRPAAPKVAERFSKILLEIGHDILYK